MAHVRQKVAGKLLLADTPLILHMYGHDSLRLHCGMMDRSVFAGVATELAPDHYVVVYSIIFIYSLFGT